MNGHRENVDPQTKMTTGKEGVGKKRIGASAMATQKKHQRRGETHDLSDYSAGSITKVVLSNFMTYSSVSLTPGPDLNVLIGPNGTGKSSFVCAIALGLNGKTELLGRAKELSEFVKRGETKAVIEITLKRNSVGGRRGGRGETSADESKGAGRKRTRVARGTSTDIRRIHGR